MHYPKSFPAVKYRLWGKMPTHKNRVERAQNVIKEAMAMELNWYVACSAGKDSTVLAHMVNLLSPGIEIWSEKDEMDFPGEREYIENLAKTHDWNLNIVSPDVNLWDEIQKIDVCEDLHSRGTDFSDKFFYDLIHKQEKKFDGVFLGLRCQESIGRTQNFKMRGHIYQRKNTKWTCNPLSTWKTEDIFAYLVCNEIDILPVYFKTKFHNNDPGEIRKSWFLPSARSAQGHCVWLKYYYPDLFYKLASISPEIKNYV